MNDLLAYLHPAMQVLVLVIAVATLRLGLALKKDRLGPRHLEQRQGGDATAYATGMAVPWLSGHRLRVRFGQHVAVSRAGAISLGAFFLRHAGLAAVSVRWLHGWWLQRGTRRYADVRDVHGFLAYLGLFVSLGVAVMGFILLP